MKPNGTKRQRGAYFTPGPIAELLATWAIRSASDSVLDPAAGRGDLLIAAARRLVLLGAKHPKTVSGVELHVATHRRFQSAMQLFGVPRAEVKQGDFFGLLPQLGRYRVVLMNPPYIRHHEIPVRALSRMSAALKGPAAGIDGRASSWAYFLLASLDLIVEGGRLGAVLPTELLTSDYGKGVTNFLRERFSRVRLIRCDRTVFPELSQRVLICLADGFKSPDGTLAECAFDSMESPPSDLVVQSSSAEGMRLGHLDTLARLTAGPDLIGLERLIADAPGVKRLGNVCKPGIGYVTGDNDFFHLTDSEVKAENLAKRHVLRVLRKAKDVQGIAFDEADWRRLADGGHPCWLFRPASTSDKVVRRILARGTRAKVDERTKCAQRRPWWRVPLGTPPPGFLVYMGAHTRIVRNRANVHVSNSFYALRPLSEASVASLAIGSMTSVFQISVALESRELGGGLRKLEPSDAARLFVPLCELDESGAGLVERLAKAGNWQSARVAADDLVLRSGLRWPSDLIASVQKACAELV